MVSPWHPCSQQFKIICSSDDVLAIEKTSADYTKTVRFLSLNDDYGNLRLALFKPRVLWNFEWERFSNNCVSLACNEYGTSGLYVGLRCCAADNEAVRG